MRGGFAAFQVISSCVPSVGTPESGTGSKVGPWSKAPRMAAFCPQSRISPPLQTGSNAQGNLKGWRSAFKRPNFVSRPLSESRQFEFTVKTWVRLRDPSRTQTSRPTSRKPCKKIPFENNRLNLFTKTPLVTRFVERGPPENGNQPDTGTRSQQPVGYNP